MIKLRSSVFEILQGSNARKTEKINVFNVPTQ